MDGGPSHKDTFDLKPDSKGAGEFKPITTSGPRHRDQRAPAEARQADAPRRARPRHEHAGRGARRGPSTTCTPATAKGRAASSTRAIGSIVSSEARPGRRPAAELRLHRQPQLRLRLPRAEAPAAARHRPDPRRRGPEGARRRRAVRQPRRPAARRWRRRSTASTRPTSITDHKTTYERAVKLMQSKEAKAFDLSPEPTASRSRSTAPAASATAA